jgi:hypothetical protein
MSAAPLRREVAQRLAREVSGLSGVAALAIVGSVARGHVDELSDLELLVVWDEVPSPSQRQALLSAWQARSTRSFTRAHLWFGVDNVRVRGFPVDVVHHTVSSLCEIEQEVLSGDLSHQEVLANVMRAEVLWGELQRPVYPPELAEKTLRICVSPAPLGALLLPLERGDLLRLHERRLDWVRMLAIALHAANHEFWPGDRAMLEVLSRLPEAPPEVGPRLRRVLEDPAALPELYSLLQEALQLAARRVPDWNAAPVLARLPTVLRRRWSEAHLQRWLDGEEVEPPLLELQSGKTSGAPS